MKTCIYVVKNYSDALIVEYMSGGDGSVASSLMSDIQKKNTEAWGDCLDEDADFIELDLLELMTNENL